MCTTRRVKADGPVVGAGRDYGRMGQNEGLVPGPTNWTGWRAAAALPNTPIAGPVNPALASDGW